ncbi:MAG: hypothetical protein JWL97_4300 [Gemmatimonadales bacterium]|jgi:hypothetical protein|nr:hypothetical protein [Gemmatimonadales bacterium]
MKPEPLMTVPEIIKELRITRRTWQHWRVRGVTPRCTKLPNGAIRVSRRDFETWLANLDEDAA